MARSGRKAKVGKREPNGKLIRSKKKEMGRIALAVDRGTEQTQAIQAIYGQDGCDAIGRAYRAGLLGEGNEAKALLDTARRISNAYWSAYAVGRFRSCIADQTSGSVAALDHEKIKRREIWLNESTSMISRMGQTVRRAFDQLVIDVNPDCGPRWLDEIIFAERRGAKGNDADRRSLELALKALQALCGQDPRHVSQIRVA